MKKENLKFLIIVVCLSLASLVSWSLYFKDYRQADTVNIHQFPKAFGSWTSQELTITEDEYAILETHNAFVRKYSNKSGKEVYLYVVYSEHNRKVSHPPEVCYIGSGLTVANNVRDFVEVGGEKKSVAVNKLLLEEKNRQQIAMYWFKVGKAFTPNYWKQQFLIARDNIFGKSVSSALIRVSVTVKEGDVKTAEKTLKEFSAEVVPYLYQFLP